MRIEFWSDVICPWCAIGAHRLDGAVARFEHADQVEIVHRSFQLDPGAPEGIVKSMSEMLHDRYGATPSQATGMCREAESAAALDGMSPFIVDGNSTGSTAWAHQMLAFASDQGLGNEAWAHLFDAYFKEARPLFDINSLVVLAAEIGLDPHETRAAIEDGRYAERVKDDERDAIAYGATSIPFTVVEGRRSVSGAEPPEVFLEMIETEWAEHGA